jgi:hypothetical protein
MSTANKFNSMDATHKAFWILLVITLSVSLCLFPFCFYKSEDGYPFSSLLWGWLLGSAIELLCYATIIKMSNTLFAKQEGHNVTTGIAVLSAAARLFLWGVGLLVSAICTFKKEWFGGFQAFNFFTTAAAYLPMLFVVLLTQFHEVKKDNTTPVTSVHEEEGEEK